MFTITATDLPRFMSCNGSRLMQNFNSSVESDQTTKEEGIAAHWLIEQVSKNIQNADELIDRKSPNNVVITGDMVDDIEDFLNGPARSGHVEYVTSFGTEHWRVNSRADRVAVIDNNLHIEDFKYGYSPVEVTENWTLIAHALGFVINNNFIPDKVIFTIYQPRGYHPKGTIREWRINYKQLIEYYEKLSVVLNNPNDILNTGAHCYKCPSLIYCPAARKAEMNALEASETAFNDTINNTELSFLLDKLTRSKKILDQAQKAFEELALHRLKTGEKIDNYTFVNDMSREHWVEHATPELIEQLTGLNLAKKVLPTPAQLRKNKVDETIIKNFSTKTQKGIKLARMTTDEKATKLFNFKP